MDQLKKEENRQIFRFVVSNLLLDWGEASGSFSEFQFAPISNYFN